ncbi:MAG: nitroreductase family protein [Bacteroidales bacterium]|nr:nitroreductase family protein [Bacteroidales bacterium]
MKTKIFFGLVMAAVATVMTSCNCEEKNQQPVNNADATINTIMQRKSVRSYTNDTIAADIMEKMLRAAVAAPSGMDVRPWHIVVMTDKSQYDTLFAGNFNMEKFKQSAAVVIFCADTTVTRAPRENPNGPAETKPNSIWRDDMGACTENFLLAAEAFGLGAVWTACYPFHDRMDPVAKYLNLPGNIVPYSIVPVGYPAGNEQPKDKWDTTRIHYNRW